MHQLDQNLSAGVLFVVGLPIGNLSDLGARAAALLSKTKVIAAEDTRLAQRLLKDIHCPDLGIKIFISYHNHNESSVAQRLIEILKSGESVVLISDAGTPGISDPGYQLIKCAHEEGIRCRVVAGPSSLTSILSVCPIGGKTLFFGGFPSPRSTERLREFTKAAQAADRLVFFEAPHRIQDHLADALTVFGNVPTFVGREMTKEHETYYWLPLAQMREFFISEPARGEFAIVYKSPELQKLNQAELKSQIINLMNLGLKDTEISSTLKDSSDLSRRELYELVQKIKRDGSDEA